MTVENNITDQEKSVEKHELDSFIAAAKQLPEAIAQLLVTELNRLKYEIVCTGVKFVTLVIQVEDELFGITINNNHDVSWQTEMPESLKKETGYRISLSSRAPNGIDMYWTSCKLTIARARSLIGLCNQQVVVRFTPIVVENSQERFLATIRTLPSYVQKYFDIALKRIRQDHTERQYKYMTFAFKAGDHFVRITIDNAGHIEWVRSESLKLLQEHTALLLVSAISPTQGDIVDLFVSTSSEDERKLFALYKQHRARDQAAKPHIRDVRNALLAIGMTGFMYASTHMPYRLSKSDSRELTMQWDREWRRISDNIRRDFHVSTSTLQVIPIGCATYLSSADLHITNATQAATALRYASDLQANASDIAYYLSQSDSPPQPDKDAFECIRHRFTVTAQILVAAHHQYYHPQQTTAGHTSVRIPTTVRMTHGNQPR